MQNGGVVRNFILPHRLSKKIGRKSDMVGVYDIERSHGEKHTRQQPHLISTWKVEKDPSRAFLNF